MAMYDKYTSAYTQLAPVVQERVEKKRYPALGFTSNLDLLCDFEVSILNRLLAQYLPQATAAEIKVPELIVTMEDLLHAIIYFCMQGIGGEVEITNGSLLDEHFAWKQGVGGTGVQAAMALAAIGCPSIVHLTDDSKEVCEILDSPHIYTVSPEGELIHTNQVISTQEQEVHYIIQFKKGDIIQLGEERITIPVSNRLILTKVTVNEHVPFFEPFFEYIENHAASISSTVLSSFNCILDPAVLQARLEYLQGHVERYKAGNPQGIVFFEEAHYHSEEIRKLCAETIYSSVDILSLNEEELQSLLAMYSFPHASQDILSAVQGVKFLREKFGIKQGVIVHTKDYSMYVGDKLGVDIERGLMYGNLVATAKAVQGWYATREQIGELLQLEESRVGLEALERISSSEYRDEVVLVPTKYLDKPKYTIGLGDSFVAGVQLCF